MKHKMTYIKKSFILKIIMLAIFNIHNSHATPTELGLITLCNVPSIGLCISKSIADYAPQTAFTFFETGRAAELISQGPGIFVQAAMIMFNIYNSHVELQSKKTIFKKTNFNNETITLKKNYKRDFLQGSLVEVLLFFVFQSGFLLYQKKLNTQSLAYAGVYSLINVIPSVLFILFKEVTNET